jgi:hypothetical protein
MPGAQAVLGASRVQFTVVHLERARAVLGASRVQFTVVYLERAQAVLGTSRLQFNAVQLCRACQERAEAEILSLLALSLHRESAQCPLYETDSAVCLV